MSLKHALVRVRPSVHFKTNREGSNCVAVQDPKEGLWKVNDCDSNFYYACQKPTGTKIRPKVPPGDYLKS